MKITTPVVVVALGLGACAGRQAQPVATAQPQDAYASCVIIQSEIQANNRKVQRLADEQGLKVAQNVAAGVGALVFWPLLFAMDVQGAATAEIEALQARQQFLGNLARQRCR